MDYNFSYKLPMSTSGVRFNKPRHWQGRGKWSSRSQFRMGDEDSPGKENALTEDRMAVQVNNRVIVVRKKIMLCVQLRSW